MNRILIIATFFLLLFSAPAFSQDEDSIAVARQLGEDVNYHPDTTVRQSTFSQEDDSIQSYKKSKDFSYMQYLDSLLRRNKELKADTIATTTTRGEKSNGGSETTSARESSSPGLLSGLLGSGIFWILAIPFIGFIIYKLFLSEGFFKRNPRQQAAVAESEEENIEQSEYDPLIRQALANKNFRLAVRYLYLQTLQKLSLAGAINFSVDKTNYEYVREVTGRPYQNNFASLTLNYEYVWYGNFEINETLYQRLQTDFRSFQQKV